jgi:hypothetical protein
VDKVKIFFCITKKEIEQMKKLEGIKNEDIAKKEAAAMPNLI